jgi:hypothetical protein
MPVNGFSLMMNVPKYRHSLKDDDLVNDYKYCVFSSADKMLEYVENAITNTNHYLNLQSYRWRHITVTTDTCHISADDYDYDEATIIIKGKFNEEIKIALHKYMRLEFLLNYPDDKKLI